MRRLIWSAVALLLLPDEVAAQSIDFRGLFSDGQAATSSRIIQLIAVITVLSVAPGILVTMTCFTRLIIALSFLRSGLGLPSTPSNIVLVSLALFMSFFIMTPTVDRAWRNGLQPFIDGKIDEKEAYTQISQPLREFMQSNVREKDLRLFEQLARKRTPEVETESVAADFRFSSQRL